MTKTPSTSFNRCVCAPWRKCFASSSTNPNENLTFTEKLGMMVDREWSERDNRRTGRRVKEAKLPVSGAIEEGVADASRGLDKSVLRALATCSWTR